MRTRTCGRRCRLKFGRFWFPDANIPNKKLVKRWGRFAQKLKWHVKRGKFRERNLSLLVKAVRRTSAEDVKRQQKNRDDNPPHPLPFLLRTRIHPFFCVRVVFSRAHVVGKSAMKSGSTFASMPPNFRVRAFPYVKNIPTQNGFHSWGSLRQGEQRFVNTFKIAFGEKTAFSHTERRTRAEDVKRQQKKRDDNPALPMPFLFRIRVHPFLFVRVVFENFSVHAMCEPYRLSQRKVRAKGCFLLIS